MNDNFREWLARFEATGRIEPLELGCCRALVLEALGDPDDASTTTDAGGNPVILKYESMEFHFGAEDNTLSLIYSETDDGIPTVSIPKRK